MLFLSNLTAIALVYALGLLLALNTTGLFTHYGLARVVAPIAVALGMFFLEHFVGLGNLAPVTPLLFGGLLLGAHRQRGVAILRQHWRTEAAFLAGFLYCLAWRWAFPDLDASSEKLTDLFFVSTYLPGKPLPPVDLWLPTERFNVYYTFQHYAAALIGRLFMLKPGVAYHLGYAFVIGLTTVAAASAIAQWRLRRHQIALILTALLAGGTGASLLVHGMSAQPPTLASSMRFIGDYATHLTQPTPLGRWIASLEPNTQAVELPVELLSYMVYIGDYHPPLAGFLLCALAVLCMALIETRSSRSRASPSWKLYGLLGATVPLTVIANTWVAPMQLLSIAAWIWYPLLRQDKRPALLPTLGLVGLAALLTVPFLQTFGANPTNALSLAWVKPQDRACPWHWMIVFWPLLLLIAMAWCIKDKQAVGRRFALLWTVLWLFAELCFVDDVYVGKFNRFNTYLKWMPWIYAGALITLAPVCLAKGSRPIRILTTALLCVMSTYAVDLGRHLLTVRKPSPGRLEGTAWLTSDVVQHMLIERVSALPPGIVLEYPVGQSFVSSPAMTMATGKPAFIGWAGHERLWRGFHRSDILDRYETARRFYEGQLEHPLEWLQTHDIRYVLWLKDQNPRPDAFNRIQAAIVSGYEWESAYQAGEFRVGFWRRRNAHDPIP